MRVLLRLALATSQPDFKTLELCLVLQPTQNGAAFGYHGLNIVIYPTVILDKACPPKYGLHLLVRYGSYLDKATDPSV